ncbi:MAG TPA: MFS transporter [Pseudomonas sp.]|nr:MFS transporter [Pseudomonas sp.]
MDPALPYWRLSGFYFAYFALLGATAPFLSLYFAHLGFSPARIGELAAIPLLMRCLSPFVWGWLGDVTGRRLAIVRLGAVCTLLAFALILFDKSFMWLAMVMALHAFFWHAILPQFEAITLNHLRERPTFYSRIRLWGSIGFIVAVVGLGWLFDWLSLDSFPAAMLVIMLAIVVTAWRVPDAAPAPASETAVQDGFWKLLWKPGVPAFFLCVVLMQSSHGPYYTFLTIHLENLGYPRGTIGLIWALGVVAEIGVFMVMARILDRFSLRRVLMFSMLLAALRWLLMGYLADELFVLLFAQLLHAASFGCFHSAAVHFVQRAFGIRHLGRGQASYATVSGMGGALGALYAGYSWSVLGAGPTFLIAAAGAALAAFIISKRLKETPHSAPPV